MISLNQNMIDFLNGKPRNKLIFTKIDDGCIDIGVKLSKLIKPYLQHKRLSMMAIDFIDEILNNNIKYSDEIGNYIAIKNIGILFEPDLKINIEHFFKNYSSDNVLIIHWTGEISFRQLFLISKENETKVDLKNITYTIYEI